MFINPSFLAKNAQNLDSAIRGRPEEVLKNIAKAHALGFIGNRADESRTSSASALAILWGSLASSKNYLAHFTITQTNN